MSPTLSESTPLLEDDPLDNHGDNWEYREPNKPFAQRAIALFQAEGESSWADSYQYFWFGAWLNILLIFVPLSFIAHHLSWNAVLRFVLSFIAIMPLAKVSSR
jgi:Ca2+:H+ antiporter